MRVCAHISMHTSTVACATWEIETNVTAHHWLQLIPLISPNDWSPVLACQDRHVRVITGNEVFYEAPTPAAPTALRYIPESHDPNNRFPNAKEVLYGTDTGETVLWPRLKE